MTMKYVFLFFFLSVALVSYGQEAENKEEREPHHRVTLMMANSHIPSATEIDGEKAVFIVPTWGLSYDYWFGEKWAVGLHNELYLQQFKIEKSGSDKTVERSYPVGVSLVGLFKPAKRWTFLAGVGQEFEKHENFNLICLETEYGFELPDNWELNLNLIYENKIEAYDTWTFGVGFSKFF